MFCTVPSTSLSVLDTRGMLVATLFFSLLDKEDEERLEQMFVADSWDDFARTMSVVRRAVSTKLCQILLGPGAAVRDKLSLFCDLFPLRRGDIATAYLAECDKLMLRPAAKADVHTIFRPSCVSAGLGGEDVLDLLDLFTLSVSVPPAKEDGKIINMSLGLHNLQCLVLFSPTNSSLYSTPRAPAIYYFLQTSSPGTDQK